MEAIVAASRAAQAVWAARPVADRLACLRRFRRLVAHDARDLAAAVAASPVLAGAGRTRGETITAEILPLAEGCRFLERRAAALLEPRRLGRGGRPLWLFGVDAELRREPLGVVLVIGPSNLPLFLPGAQALQALAAGNAVLLKPGTGGREALLAFAQRLEAAGIDPRLVPVLPEAPEAAQAAIAAGVDKVVLTGSATTGSHVLAALAPRLVPASMELSGADPLFVLSGADLDLVAEAILYGLRFNGGQTCIAPRRVFVPAPMHDDLVRRVTARAATLAPVTPAPATLARLASLLDEARAAGAVVTGGAAEAGGVTPALVSFVRPPLTLLEADLFAPVVAFVPVADAEEALALAASCPYALGASVFGPEAPARTLAARVRAGSVTINDVIVPTADPRLPFGGRGRSGFGVTRGAEGLLALTALKVVTVRRGGQRPHFAAPRPADERRFALLVRWLHGGWRRPRPIG